MCSWFLVSACTFLRLLVSICGLCEPCFSHGFLCRQSVPQAVGDFVGCPQRLGGGLLGSIQIAFDILGKGEDVCQCQCIPALVEPDW